MTNCDKCKECGRQNDGNDCYDNDVHLHIEIENLRQKLVERDTHIATMESDVFNDVARFPQGELGALRDELQVWQDKYRRLYDAHRRIQRVNQGLEDKLLKLVDTCETEKSALTRDVATLSHKLADANYAIKKLTADNERYRDDVALAIQFLQCKQTNFVSQKIESLPNEVQAKVSSYVASKRRQQQPEEKKPIQQADVKSIKVPIPTFPPTAMFYSIPKSSNISTRTSPQQQEADSPVDIVSASIVAKILEERERERALAKHCDTCTCSSKNLRIVHNVSSHSVGTQTVTTTEKTSLCLRCNSPVLDAVMSGNLKVVKPLDISTARKSIGKICEGGDGTVSLTTCMDPKIAKVEPNNYLKESSGGGESAVSSSSIGSCAASDISNKSASLPPNLDDLSITTRRSAGGGGGGPRYCSVRVQTGSKNILLDNVHDGITPVLYTHPHDKKIGTTVASKQHRHHKKRLVMLHGRGGSRDELPKSARPSADTLTPQQQQRVQNQRQQQRVAEWIESNRCRQREDDSNYYDSESHHRNVTSNYNRHMSNNNSDGVHKSITSSSTINEDSTIDPARYAEMESNVKKFLLGESQSEFLKKVAIGKQNYQNLRGSNNNSDSVTTPEQDQASHVVPTSVALRTETQI